MIRQLLRWVRDNKLSTALIVILILVFFGQRSVSNLSVSNYDGGYVTDKSIGIMEGVMRNHTAPATREQTIPPATGGGGSTPVNQRMVSKNAYISMVVKDVTAALNAMTGIAEGAGGYVITSSLSNPEGNGYATVSVRVLSSSLQIVLDSFKKLGIKTVSENIEGTDITDQFKDVQEHLRVILETKTKFEAMLKSSVDVQDSLSVLREIQSLQYQIDQLRGEERYLSESAKYSRITVNISMDEYELPYAPEEPWSGEAVLKNAVRELIRTLRGYAERLIWIGVFGVIWIPITLISYLLYRRFFRKML